MEDKIVESFENYLRGKLLDLKNDKLLEKKLKTYKKDLDTKFKNKIKDLNNLANDQAKYDSLISNLITKMDLDENNDEEDTKEEENKEENLKNPKNQEQKTEKQQQEQQEMSIESGIPDLENEAKDSDQANEEIEVEDHNNSDIRKNLKNNLGDLKYKTYTEEFDEIIKAEELENEEELNRLRKNLDQQLLQLKNFISKLANKLQKNF